MADRPSAPRILPLPQSERSEIQQDLLAGAILVEANIFTTFVRAPGLFRRWLPFGGRLLNGKLPPRDRELLILRTGWNCRAQYEWGQHVRFGLDAGVAPEEIERVARPELDGWEPFEATLLRAADELHDQACISDETWAMLAERYDTQQLIELPMLVGHYHLVAMTLNSLGVQLDEGLTGFPD
jgi:4-carboxymuconolactone decarboxylase